MVDVLLRRGRRAEAGRRASPRPNSRRWAGRCAPAPPRRERMPAATGALAGAAGRSRPDTGRACSCDRIGCPAPGAHPLSAAWQIEASSDAGEVSRWWRDRPDASIILVTGRVFDVLDVPAARAGRALERMDRTPAATGPVALSADHRAYFFVHHPWRARRRGRMVVVPPGLRAGQLRPGGRAALALPGQLRGGPAPAAGRGPGRTLDPGSREHALPDCLRLLEFLADACEEAWNCGAETQGDPPACSAGRAPIIPGGVNSPVRAFGAVGGEPVFIASGHGPYLTDTDGNAVRGPGLLVGPDDPRARPSRGGGGGHRGGGPGHLVRRRDPGEVELAEEIVARTPVEQGPAGQLRDRGDDVGGPAGPGRSPAGAWW